MLYGQSSRDDDSRLSDEERARIQARLQALDAARSNDSTRRTGPNQTQAAHGYRGDSTRTAAATPDSNPDVDTRAYLLTAGGGVLAEVPCHADAGVISIGRSHTSGIRIDDPYVHRNQAEVRWDAEERAHFITHVGGDNGTYVNRHRVQKPFRLVGGEQLRLGRTKLVYRIRR